MTVPPPAISSFAAAPDGVRLAVYEWGNPSGPELLLVHGFAQCHLCFTPQVRSALAQDFRIVAFDFRGHGASDKPGDARAYQGREVWARDLAAVLDHAKLKRPVVAGWSMGRPCAASVSDEFRRCAPRRHQLRGVPRDRESRASRRHVVASAGRGPIARRAARGHDPLPRCALRHQAERGRFPLGAGLQHAAARAGSASDLGLVPDRSGRDGRGVEARTGAGARHAGPKGCDRAAPGGRGWTAAAIPHARISWFDECGHSPFCEDAPRFNAELSAFVMAAQQY